MAVLNAYSAHPRPAETPIVREPIILGKKLSADGMIHGNSKRGRDNVVNFVVFLFRDSQQWICRLARPLRVHVSVVGHPISVLLYFSPQRLKGTKWNN